MTVLGIDEAQAALRHGEVILLNTDSLPGLHALATVEGAAGRLAALKGHVADRPFLLLVDSVQVAFRLGSTATPAQAEQLAAIWPSALTALLKPSRYCPPEWRGGRDRVGIRVPASDPLRAFLAGLPGPLLSTSANAAGQPPAADLASAARLFPSLPVLELGIETVAGPSTLVDFVVNPANVEREGIVAYPSDSGPQGAA